MKVMILVVGVFALAMGGLLYYSITIGHEQDVQRQSTWYEEGREAGKSGVPPEAVPYSHEGVGGADTNDAHYHWKKGWQAGYIERQKEIEKKQREELK